MPIARAIINIYPQRCTRCGFSWPHSRVHIEAAGGASIGAEMIAKALKPGETFEIYATHTANYTTEHLACFRCTVTLPDWFTALRAEAPTLRKATAQYDNTSLDDLLKL